MKPRLLAILTLVVVGALTYLCATQAGFLAIDDVGMVQNIKSNSYTLGGLFFSGASEYYRPLTVISYFANASFTGVDPFYFHLVNVVIHIANALLVYWFALVFFFRRDDVDSLAFIASLFFLVAPINSEAASWVSARPDLLCTFFFLLATVLLVKVREQATASAMVFVGIAYLASLCAKEASIAMAAIAPLYLLSQARRERLKDAVLLAAPVLVTTGIYLFLRFGRTVSVDKGVKSVVKGAIANGSATTPPLLDGVGAFGFYLQKLVFPFPLNFTILRYDRPVAYMALLAGCLVALYLLRRHRRETLLPLLIIFIGIAPAVLAYLGRIPWTPFGERYLYLPMVGFSLLVALGLSRLKSLPRIVPIACVMLLAIPTMARVALWCDPDAFWKDALKKGPGLAKSHSALGVYAYEQQRYDDAERYMKQSLSLSEEPLVWQNLALVYQARKDMKKYEEAMLRAASLSPRPTSIYTDLILALMSAPGKEGDGAVYRKAVGYHLLAVSKDPTYVDAYYYAGKLCLANKEPAEARKYFGIYLEKARNGYYRPFAQKMFDRLSAGAT
ncbi:hypothetical protein [Geomonas oryzae]|uniref:hypothetical protein n=1 Tax=Geomonas oryzae TaxID=2364273 RepID=UPI00100AF5EF|nr:hypothetical protein [Geomonas oryzae]